jgi:transcriptional regulator with XRE-family HTH domain
MPLYNDVGERIRARRDVLSMTQGALGARLVPPLTRAAISNIECGRQNVYLHTVYGIASVLEIDVRDLLPVTNDIEFVESMVKDQIHQLNLKETVGDDIMRVLASAMKSTPKSSSKRKHGKNG